MDGYGAAMHLSLQLSWLFRLKSCDNFQFLRTEIKLSPNDSNETISLYFLSERATDAVCLAAPRASTTKPCAASGAAPAWERDTACMHRCTAGRERRETSPSPTLWSGCSSGTKERYSLMPPFPQARMRQVPILVAVVGSQEHEH
jgi:hypothetical protein